MANKLWNSLYSTGSRTSITDDQHIIDAKPINGKEIFCRGCKTKRQSRKSRHDGINGFRCIECGKFHTE